ncbi:hypothetical protein [Wolbachia endosymbiont of Frankliniella intonsa]|uniref:hypothetical protein n=1 Tax=Wolbachia endosymbiont of Frankliniella intonsa TaxID=2902422 RepID=UPI00244EDEA0|nr:hypothetical protein [Wolbachia endosymbiont of Frankliniella intonsa]WGJ61968.1 hypothetical protein M3L71_06865 [Wolbachia endosymbiont of Frankliniella intonsa]
MTVPPVKAESSKSPIKESEIIFKEEHKAIYDAFMEELQDKAKSQESPRITNVFISDYEYILLNNVNPEKIRPLSEENFCQFLLSVLKEIREKKLAREEDSKVKQIVEGCLDDVRGTEARDWVVDFVKRKIPGRGLLKKIPGLGKVLDVKEEEDKPLLSDEEMVTKFLRKVFLPIFFSIASILIFGPTTLAIIAAVIGTIFAVKGGIEVLFSNNRPGTLYDPSSPDKDDIEKREKLNEKIRNGIDDIFKTEIKEITEQISQGDGENKQHFASERVCSPRKETPSTLKQPTLDQPAKSTEKTAVN